jgi:hypothetical protein
MSLYLISTFGTTSDCCKQKMRENSFIASFCSEIKEETLCTVIDRHRQCSGLRFSVTTTMLRSSVMGNKVYVEE